MGSESEAMGARGIIVLVKSSLMVKNIENKKKKLVKARLSSAKKPALFATRGL